METFSVLLAVSRGIHQWPVNKSQHKSQWRGALVFSLICAWINDWVNNRGASVLKRHRAHHDVTVKLYTWWSHQMDTFSALLAICAGNSPVPGDFPTQRLVTRSFDVYFDLRLNKRLCKQSWGWWLETLLCPLWRHSNEQSQPIPPTPPLLLTASPATVDWGPPGLWGAG